MSTTATFKPAADGDNVYTADTTLFTENTCCFGNDANYIDHSYFRFPDITIPPYSTITSANILFTSSGDYNQLTKTNIYGNDADTSVAPTNYSEFNALTLTTAVVPWTITEPYFTNVTFSTNELTTIIQEIVNRTSWSSGNAIGIIIKNNNSGVNLRRRVYSYKYGDISKVPLLTITYTYIVAEPIIVTSSIPVTSAEPTDWNVLIAPVTNITSSIGLQGVYEVHLSSYCYEEATKGIASGLVLKTKDGIGTDILNIFRRKNTKYLWYDADTNGQDLVVSFYVDGVLEDRTLTINNSGRIRNRLDLWNMEGYRFAIKLNAQDVMERGMKIYSPWNIIYDYAGV